MRKGSDIAMPGVALETSHRTSRPIAANLLTQSRGTVTFGLYERYDTVRKVERVGAAAWVTGHDLCPARPSTCDLDIVNH